MHSSRFNLNQDRSYHKSVALRGFLEYMSLFPISHCSYVLYGADCALQILITLFLCLCLKAMIHYICLSATDLPGMICSALSMLPLSFGPLNLTQTEG